MAFPQNGEQLVLLMGFAEDVFLGRWSAAWTSAKGAFTSAFSALSGAVKAPVNAVIAVLNGLLSAVTAAVNAVRSALSALSFKVPDWVPGIGGKKLGFSFDALRAPSLPYLASGAVIPPNAPFFALLGDQTSGTNIEAPLETIKDAVRDVLSERGATGSNNVYRFTAQLGRRVLFDELIAEARMRQAASGRDPFLLE